MAGIVTSKQRQKLKPAQAVVVMWEEQLCEANIITLKVEATIEQLQGVAAASYLHISTVLIGIKFPVHSRVVERRGNCALVWKCVTRAPSSVIIIAIHKRQRNNSVLLLRRAAVRCDRSECC